MSNLSKIIEHPFDKLRAGEGRERILLEFLPFLGIIPAKNRRQ
jgi:hypothetical protein